jgi:hypothetical protein
MEGEMVDCTAPKRLKTMPNYFPWMKDELKPALIRHKGLDACEWWEGEK